MRLGPWEIGMILLVILMVFGVGKLPQIGGLFGKMKREFRKAAEGEDEEEEIAKKAAKTATKV